VVESARLESVLSRKGYESSNLSLSAILFMKKIMIAFTCLMFAAGIIACGDIFAQRDVNIAQEAAKKARESIEKHPKNGASEIEGTNAVNTNEPAANSVTIGEDGSIKIGHEDNQPGKQP
jgi:hypothetical protein